MGSRSRASSPGTRASRIAAWGAGVAACLGLASTARANGFAVVGDLIGLALALGGCLTVTTALSACLEAIAYERAAGLTSGRALLSAVLSNLPVYLLGLPLMGLVGAAETNATFVMDGELWACYRPAIILSAVWLALSLLLRPAIVVLMNRNAPDRPRLLRTAMWVCLLTAAGTTAALMAGYVVAAQNMDYGPPNWPRL